MQYRPDLEPRQVFRDEIGDLFGNRFDDRALENLGKPVHDPVNVFATDWTDIFENVCGEAAEQLITWIAWIYQRRQKTMVMPILYGAKGTGKSTITRLIAQVLARNVKYATAADFHDRNGFTSWSANGLVCFIEDFVPSKEVTSYQILDKLKTY